MWDSITSWNWHLIALLTIILMPFLALIASIFWFIPHSLHLFQKWRQTLKPKEFSAMVFLCFLSFTLLAFAYIIWIHALLDYELQIPSGFLKFIIFLVTVFL